MNHPNIKSVVSIHSPRPSRRILATLLLLALAVAVLAGSAFAAATNLVKNGSFEKGGEGGGIPTRWGFPDNLQITDKRVCNQSKSGSCSFLIVGDGLTKGLSQRISVPGFEGDEVYVTAWAKGKYFRLDGGTGQLRVLFNHTDGSSNEEFVYVPYGTFPWTLLQGTAVADENYNSIDIGVYSYNADGGKVWFDKVKLVGP
jgi:hypothetical protein